MYLSSLPNVARPYTEAALATGQFPYLRNLPDPTANFVVTNKNSAALSPLDILTMATTGGMHGLGMEKELGQIAVGQRADLVFWNQLDWSAMIDLESNRDIIGRIVRTRQTATDVYVDGQQVVANGEPLFITSRDLFRRYLNERVSELNRRSKELRVDIPWLET